MGTLERRETLTHRLGPAGRLSVKTVTGLLRVRGIEGEDAHVTVTYRIRAADQASAERALQSGRVAIERGVNSLEIETPERRLSTGLAWLFGGARVSADIAVEVPWGAKVRFETMSGSVEAVNLVGDQKYRTVSGDIRLWNLAGLVEAATISGGIALDGGTALRLRASTISGGIRARAGLFHSLSLSTTSGSMTVVGALDPAGDHRAESISGGVDLTPLSGVTAELKTVSGSVHSDVQHRVEGGRGFWRAIVGDGRACLRVNSTSGSLRLLAPRPSDTVAGQGSGQATGPTNAPAAPGAPAGPGTPPAPTAAVPTAEPGPTAYAAAREEPAESWDPNETAEETADHERDERAEDEELAVLQALERGEIGVDEASARLERTGR
ncbi:MAG: DUF4097 family beta strand repeat-containing protein [Candidatus Limnocylindrales bacterium]|jgi:hypothetical protein